MYHEEGSVELGRVRRLGLFGDGKPEFLCLLNEKADARGAEHSMLDRTAIGTAIQKHYETKRSVDIGRGG